MSRRANPVVRREPDGTFTIVLDDRTCDALDALLEQLDELLEAAPDDPSLERLHPTAYHDDPERDAAYQLLAGDELRTKRRATIEAVRTSLHAPSLTEADLWAWLQALNSLRLVVGTRLGLETDDHDRPLLRSDDPAAALWDVYDFTTDVQRFVVEALHP